MALHITEDPNDWRTDFTPAELISRMRALELPEVIINIATGSAPPSLEFRCEPIRPNGIWPLQDDFIPVWTCNGSSAVAYEPSTGRYHSLHIEEIMDSEPDTFYSFRHLSAWVVRQLIDAGRSDIDVTEAARFLGFTELDQLKTANSLENFMEQHGAG